MKKVRVIGAGMNGLLVAYYLREQGMDVEVFERAAHVGGKIQTFRSPNGLLESAANAILADAEVEAVAARIGMELEAASDASRARYILRNRPRRWPLGILASLRLLIFIFRWKFFAAGVTPAGGETLATWGARVLGREAVDYLLDPACAGIFAAPPEKLSATLIYNYFFKSPPRKRAVLKGSVHPVGGMGEFPARLRAHLEKQGVVFTLNRECNERGDGDTILATDLASAAELLRSWRDPRGEDLSQLPTVDLVSVNAFAKAPVKSLRGFGLLFPRRENKQPLGVLFNQYIFPSSSEKNLSSSTWIYGGPSPKDMMALSDSEILSDVQKNREEILKNPGELSETRVHRWPQALPLYGVDLEKVLEGLAISQNGVHLIGNYLGEIGLNRFFHRAKRLAQTIAHG